MAEKEEIKEMEEKESKKSKKSFLKLLFVFAFVVVLAGGGYAGWSMFFKKEAVADLLNVNGSEGSELKEIKQSIIYPLESFIVNLMDKSESGKRYLKTTIELDVMGQEGLDLIKSRQAQLRDAILLLLTSQSFMEINTIEGKLELKRSILLRINQVLSEKVVNNIYFTEFVVQ